jgi:hypothetical protein
LLAGRESRGVELLLVLHTDAKGFLGSKVVDEPALELKLNQFGEKGWELVTVQQLTGSSTTVHVFKRSCS